MKKLVSILILSLTLSFSSFASNELVPDDSKYNTKNNVMYHYESEASDGVFVAYSTESRGGENLLSSTLQHCIFLQNYETLAVLKGLDSDSIEKTFKNSRSILFFNMSLNPKQWSQLKGIVFSDNPEYAEKGSPSVNHGFLIYKTEYPQHSEPCNIITAAEIVDGLKNYTHSSYWYEGLKESFEDRLNSPNNQ